VEETGIRRDNGTRLGICRDRTISNLEDSQERLAGDLLQDRRIYEQEGSEVPSTLFAEREILGKRQGTRGQTDRIYG